MKVHTRNTLYTWLCCIALLSLVSGCTTVNTSQTSTPDETPAPKVAKKELAPPPAQLPVRFQRPSFIVEQETSDMLAEDSADYAIKVGANINSTRGPQPLWDILKRLANLKGMSVSWASDVDQNVKVDVNISADDDYFKAIDNLLRQVDYFHEVHGNTIVVKYKETKRFHLSIPYMKGSYTTTVGGNFLTNRNAATGTEGTVKITSDDNTFDVWENIQANLDTIMQQWQIRQVTPTATDAGEQPPEGEQQPESEVPMDLATRSVTSGDAYYTVDRNVGLITVTAPRTVLEKVENYLSSLKKELYRQVIIEAKIIEVYLQDNSKVGIDWTQVLKDFSVTGQVTFGDNTGQIYPSSARFVSKVALSPVNFTVMLNALNEQGDAHVLSNPKITVLNGQPALISVGKDITYLKSVSKDIDNDAGTITYTAETDNIVEGISLGVVATILDDDSVILHLTPITTDLIDDTIQYEVFGNEGLKVGVPKVGVRQMSTMVQVDNGEMLIIGGLIDKVKRNSEEFAPVVGDIPILKYLFGYEEKVLERRELVILLMPKII